MGLLKAGWTGHFAIEKNRDAFNTLAKNLMSNRPRASFSWPKWLPRKACSTAKFLANHDKKLRSMRGEVDLLAGAPPCQGFSLAGRRLHSDPRNSLFRQYLEIVKRIEPRVLLVENVQGFSFPFKSTGKRRKPHKPYSQILTDNLQDLGYTVFSEMINFREFGVPQDRTRFILVGIRCGDTALLKLRGRTPFEILRSHRKSFLLARKLSAVRPISVRQALADLEVNKRALADCQNEPYRGFKQIRYAEARNCARFVSLMRRGTHSAPDSIRLPRHKTKTVRQFQRILRTCTPGQSLSKRDRKRLGIKKQALTPLHPRRPSSTVTTLPDDIIHYSEPRILTVRENARLQTFPDWFEFTGKYTTGGKDRRRDCPRYTQVGNAVPPLFAEAIGSVLRKLAF